MADNNKVTIDADYFAELYRKANQTDTICKECKEERTAEEFNALKKERDELKAMLDHERMNKCDEVTAKRLAAAERCIEDCEAALLKWLSDGDDEAVRSMYDNARAIIRAYREKKEAK